MARVVIDPHMFSEAWFSTVLAELLEAPAVIFAYGGLPKEKAEMAKVRDALKFFKRVTEMKRMDRAHADTINRFHNSLLEDAAWTDNHRLCDDPHYFALIRALPSPFIFSNDHRMAQCRRCLSGKVTREYLGFAVIGSQETYSNLRYRVLN